MIINICNNINIKSYGMDHFKTIFNKLTCCSLRDDKNNKLFLEYWDIKSQKSNTSKKERRNTVNKDIFQDDMFEEFNEEIDMKNIEQIFNFSDFEIRNNLNNEKKKQKLLTLNNSIQNSTDSTNSTDYTMATFNNPSGEEKMKIIQYTRYDDEEKQYTRHYDEEKQYTRYDDEEKQYTRHYDAEKLANIFSGELADGEGYCSDSSEKNKNKGKSKWQFDNPDAQAIERIHQAKIHQNDDQQQSIFDSSDYKVDYNDQDQQMLTFSNPMNTHFNNSVIEIKKNNKKNQILKFRKNNKNTNILQHAADHNLNVADKLLKKYGDQQEAYSNIFGNNKNKLKKIIRYQNIQEQEEEYFPDTTEEQEEQKLIKILKEKRKNRKLHNNNCDQMINIQENNNLEEILNPQQNNDENFLRYK